MPYDPYGLEYGDWEDPEVHDSCSGCPACFPWEGRSYEAIRTQREALVRRWRIADGTDGTPQEVARQDDDYWNNQEPPPACST